MQDHRIPARVGRAARSIAHRLAGRRSLRWCHGCGAMVAALGHDDLCAQCEEIDARLAAHVGSAALELTERMLTLALEHLHPDDVRMALARVAAEQEPAAEPLAVVRARSQAMVRRRVVRTRRRADDQRE